MQENKSVLNTLTPQKLFLIDGLGAILSAFLLGVVLTSVESIVGMPLNTLYLLAFLPCLFALYDFVCYWKITKNQSIYLKAIAFANLAYCCLSLYFLILHWPMLTALGVLYFVSEIMVVLVLVRIELKVAKGFGEPKTN